MFFLRPPLVYLQALVRKNNLYAQLHTETIFGILISKFGILISKFGILISEFGILISKFEQHLVK